MRFDVYEHPYVFFISLSLISAALIHYLPQYWDVEKHDQRGRTALMRAAEQGDIAEVKSLLKRGADIEARDDCRWSALLHAALNGHSAVIELLLAQQANIADRDKGGYSALMLAASNNHIDSIHVLAKAGANLDAQDTELGWNALIWAIQAGHKTGVQHLLQLGADPHLRDKSGLSANDWLQGKSVEPVLKQ